MSSPTRRSVSVRWGGRFDDAAFANVLATSDDVRLEHADARHIVLHPASL
ncbi:MAG: hypothetical protein J6386_20235 [Candidatus Synoicihabitans palmerolidicus]|nr:hypothetical protein [Candidatus Synoicihabitans palmerolidicus]